ncbi:MAG: nucleotidyltransferase [Clostridia bacterium]|nr:nucleotidyltransferase [Clostridia bacterium]MBR6741561.1 nucleotidyltransferase [Clostridia bacterium]
MKKDITLIVMAAGMGSRFGGLKQIEPVGKNGEAILDFTVYDAIKAGFTKVVFVIKHAIENDFKEFVGSRIAKKIKVEYVFQEIDKLPDGFTAPDDRQKPWGTAHAILCCKDVVNEPFAVVNADDFYGRSALQKVADFLKSETENYCMVGFRLANTLTENGSVSRGVCEIDDQNHLTTVTERTKIIDCKYTEDDGQSWTSLSPDTVVSMNLWGFMPDIFEFIEKGFKEFLKTNINLPKSEYYLPTVVSSLIDNGQKNVEVLVAEDKWYGITYKEDKQKVVNAIGEMIDAGIYENM